MDDCIVPQRADRYASVRWEGRTMGGHRVVWLQAHGEIPKGMCVLHRCDVKGCINLDHLFLGTQADNMADKVAKGRQAKGARNGAAKLTDEQFREVVRRGAAGDSLTSIAADMGVTIQAISQYLKRQRRTLVRGG